MRGCAFGGSDMTSLPVGANPSQTATQTTTRNGDATVVRAIAAGLVVLALVAVLVIERPAAYGIAATIVVGAVGLFAAARWRRADLSE